MIKNGQWLVWILFGFYRLARKAEKKITKVLMCILRSINNTVFPEFKQQFLA